MDKRPLIAFNAESSSYTRFPEQLSDADFWDLATQSARSVPPLHVGANEFLLCTLKQGCCMLPLKVLGEILTPPYYFSLLPLAPLWMPGLSAWRGEVIAVVDMDAYLFFHPPTSPGCHEEGMLLVAHYNDLKLGLFVSSVETFVASDEGTLLPLQPIVDRFQHVRSHVIKGAMQVHEKEVLLLDSARMFVDIEQSMRATTLYE